MIENDSPPRPASATDDAGGDAGEEALEGEIVDEGGDPTGGAGPAWARGADPGSGDHPGAVYSAAVTAAGPRSGRGGLTFGAVLVVAGAVLLAQHSSEVVDAGGWSLVVGLAFLTWWAFRGTFGLLLPAGVLTGLGLGLVAQQAVDVGNPVALGLGGGFLAIFLLGQARRREARWWLLVPGVVLVIVGLLQDTSGWDALGGLGWPLLLIVVGLLVAGAALSRRRS